MPSTLSTRRLVLVERGAVPDHPGLPRRARARGRDPTQVTAPATAAPHPADRDLDTDPYGDGSRGAPPGFSPDQGGAVPEQGGAVPGAGRRSPGHLRVVNRVDERFRCMGCDARVRLESALVPEPELRRTAAAVRAALATPTAG